MIGDNCEWPGCQDPATELVYNKRARVVFHYCKYHGDYVLNFDNPEYVVSCPNCSCQFSVN